MDVWFSTSQLSTHKATVPDSKFRVYFCKALPARLHDWCSRGDKRHLLLPPLRQAMEFLIQRQPKRFCLFHLPLHLLFFFAYRLL